MTNLLTLGGGYYSRTFSGLRGNDYGKLYSLNEDEGPCVLIEGIYQGREVLLQVLAYAPDEEEPGLEIETE